MTAVEPLWAERAAAAVATRFGRTWPWHRGLWVTSRPSYRPVPIPAGFETRVVDAGAPRRVLVHEGEGDGLLLLPGLYATLDEGLFLDVAALAAARGHRVVLVEDRLGASTLRLTGGEVVGAARQAAEAQAIAENFRCTDILAFSTGAHVAFRMAARRVVAWSAALDPGAVAAALARSGLLSRYYAAVHRRAFTGAGLPVPPVQAVREVLAADGPAPRCSGPWVLVHARGDPVVPVDSITPWASAPGGKALLTPGGGHLGFGRVAGDGVWLVPLETR